MVVLLISGVLLATLVAVSRGKLAGAGFSGDSAPTIPTPSAPNIYPTNENGDDTMIFPSDRSTWPSGDKIWQLCQAIAVAEGYGQDGDVPTTHHNPGDLSPGDTGYPGDFHSGSFVSQEPDDVKGWNDLYHKWANILAGNSRVYSPSMTFLEIAHKYAGDWSNWVRNVTNDLNVSPSTTLQEWYNS